ncbi:uncharacterized protein SCODWIG_01808 [Saccharomycodes ludwigii]|uniref:pH-response regulator protein palF/RIM8 n=1 Tax=Saccharomycodes ludwigii TaxID=36035 RepID=A0A376B5S5_9ASCO|nr:uncharacterized protein SCODWIG_01808 [Saccharomycodes ludwigii]
MASLLLDLLKKRPKILSNNSNNHGGSINGLKNVPNHNNTNLANRNKNVIDPKIHSPSNNALHIHTDCTLKLINPPATYKPNDVLCGEVHLKLQQDIANIQLILIFEGEITLKVKRASHVITKCDHKKLFYKKITLYGSNNKSAADFDTNNECILNGLTKGEHIFPFKIKIPGTNSNNSNNNTDNKYNKRIYTSINFEKGSISYSLTAQLESLSNNGHFHSNTSKTLGILDNNQERGNDENKDANNIYCNTDDSRSNLFSNQHHVVYAKATRNIAILSPLDVSSYDKPNTKTIYLQFSPSNTLLLFEPKRKLKSKNKLDNLDGVSRRTAATVDTTSRLPVVNMGSVVSKAISKKNDKTNGGKVNIGYKESKNSSSSSISENNADNNKNKRTIEISIGMDRSGFILGEEFPINIHIKHYKSYIHPIGVIATLVRICKVNTGSVIETFRKDLCQSILPILTKKTPENDCADNEQNEHEQRYEYNEKLWLKIPNACFPTLILDENCCNFFNFQYYVEILFNLSSKNEVVTESNQVLFNGDQATITSLHHRFSQQNNNRDTTTSTGTGYSTMIANNNGTNRTNNDDIIVLQKCNLSNRSVNDYHSIIDDPMRVIFYQDLINIDQLKKLKNVTGMSLEVIVGTHRNPTICKENENTSHGNVSPATNNNSNDILTNKNCLDNIYDQLLASNGCYDNGNNEDINVSDKYSWILNNTIPKYALPSFGSSFENSNGYEGSNTSIIVDDKKELERKRLQMFESEPPSS